MPDFLPFPAVQYASPTPGTADVSAVCAPPYDVIEPEDRVALLAEDPHNAVRLILPDRYDAAAEHFTQWQRDGVLVVDDRPTFSIYRMHYTGDDGAPRTTTGVIGALALDRDGVLPHERTLPKAKSDRLELLRATRANFDPIWGISLAPRLSELLEPDGEPRVDCTRPRRCAPRALPRHRSGTPGRDRGGGRGCGPRPGRRPSPVRDRVRLPRRAGRRRHRAGAIMTLVVELAPTSCRSRHPSG